MDPPFALGTITRQRNTVNNTEKSIIDHFIVCEDMYAYVVKLQIDEERKYCLTKFTNKTGSTTCTKESDHNTLILEIDKRWNTSENDVESKYQDIHTLQNKLENVNNKLGCASVKLLV